MTMYPAMILCPHTTPADALTHPDGLHRCIQQILAEPLGDHLGEHTCACGVSFVVAVPPGSPLPVSLHRPPDYPHDGSDPAAAATAGGARGSAAVVYLLWSQTHQAWWGVGGWGYTESIEHAGRFSEAEAIRYTVGSAQCGIRDQVSFMVAAPDNWADPAACRVCGCTQARACEGGCYRVVGAAGGPLCSACAIGAGPLPEPAGGWAEHDQAAVRESQDPS